jgi:UPF0755 protein
LLFDRTGNKRGGWPTFRRGHKAPTRESLFRVAGALLVMFSVFGGWLLMDHQVALKQPLKVTAEPRVYVVESGTSLRQVVNDLAAQGILEQPGHLVWHARWRGQAEQIKAGEYLIEPGMTPLRLLERLVSGKTVQRSLTIVEGWTFDDLLLAIHSHPHLDQTLAGLDREAMMAQLDLPTIHPEGWFYPETYYFPSGAADRDFLKRAHSAMVQRLHDEWVKRSEGLPLENKYEALILASIVEKETGHPGERAQVAGVFIHRLHKGMRLASDPTVIYGLGDDFDGDLRRQDLSRDTPYNTYLHKGLPPTPIAMPGGKAIHAVLHPAVSDALFFVSKGDGSHHFSSTYAEHRRAVSRYQLNHRRSRTSTEVP